VSRKFKIVYCPFLTSDLEAEAIVWANDEEDAQKIFERQNPHGSVRSVEETA
jgi:hypothetical protein